MLVVACYRILNVKEEWEDPPVKGLQGARASAFFVHRRLTYLDTADGIYPAPTGDEIVSDSSLFRWPDLPKAPYLLLLSPFDDNARFQSRLDAGREIDTLLGIINLVAGLNAGERRIFVLDVDLASGEYIGTAGPIVLSHGGPLELSTSIDEIVRAADRLAKLDEAKGNRARLSLRWFTRGVREFGHDGLIALWVAIETLSMPDETNANPAITAMARIYGIDRRTAVEVFQLGRIQGVRSRILHEGDIPTIDERLNRLLAEVYRDLLVDFLGLEPHFWAKGFLEEAKFSVGEYLRSFQRSN